VSILLTSPDIDVNAADREGLTALHFAVQSKKDACIRQLVSRFDVNMSAKDLQGNTPLHIAVAEKLDDLVWILLSRRDTLITIANKDNETPLTLAAVKDSESVLQRIVATGHRVRLHIPQHQGLLHRVIASGSVEVLRNLLLIPGINVNEEIEGQTPLMLAVKEKNIQIVLLMMASPQIDLSAEPLARAVAEGIRVRNLAFLRICLAMEHIDINCEAAVGPPPLIAAVCEDAIEAVDILLSCPRVNVNVQDSASKSTALHYAAQRDNVVMVKRLMAVSGIRPDLANTWNQMPKHLAKSKTILKLLKHNKKGSG
jgi:ankyrin repeat protein